MELLETIWNEAQPVWLIKAFILEIFLILAAIAAYDNRIDLETVEAPQPMPVTGELAVVIVTEE